VIEGPSIGKAAPAPNRTAGSRKTSAVPVSVADSALIAGRPSLRRLTQPVSSQPITAPSRPPSAVPAGSHGGAARYSSKIAAPSES
jgi:hypothetical protein